MRIIRVDAASRGAQPADPRNFSGDVTQTRFLSADETDGASGARFDYAPEARSFWHIHTEEQVIVGMDGVGLAYWAELPEAMTVRPGDWWYVAAGVAHWHGATPSGSFGHLAVNTGGEVLWLDEVSDEQYRAVLPADLRR
jgi:quercetin dioxygenase-like cupin family protein